MKPLQISAAGAMIILVAFVAISTRVMADEDKSASPIAKTKEGVHAVGHTTHKVVRAVGHGTRDAARSIGHGTRDAAHGIGHAGKKAWRELTGTRNE